jgi:hypothetical protein
MWQIAQRKKETPEQEREQHLINKLFVQVLKHKLKSVEQIQMRQEHVETRRSQTGLRHRLNARLLQTESQQTELITPHQLVV